jgi:hypothetical protein
MKKATIVVIVALLAAILLMLEVVLFLLILFSLPDVKSSDMIGSYAGSYEVFPKITYRLRKGIYEDGTHLLELKSDQTYTYIYDPIDGNSVEISGLWQFKPGYRGRDIVLSNFLLAPSAESSKKSGYRAFPIHKRFYKPIRLSVNSDAGFYLVKQKKRSKVGSKR